MEYNAKDLNQSIKIQLNKVPEHGILKQLKNLEAKIESEKKEFKIYIPQDSKTISNLHAPLGKYDDAIDKAIKPIGLSKPKEEIAKQILLKMCLNYFLDGITSIALSLFLFMFQSKMYDSIRSNPEEFRALYNRLPENTVFKDDKVIINNEGLSHEALPPTLAIISIFNTLDENDVIDFYRFASKTPYLCLDHPVGKYIYEKFKTSKMKTFKKRIIKVIYRGRIREHENRPFQEEEMFAPPYGFAGHGRGNMLGVPALYFTDSLGAVVEEVNWRDGDCTIDVIKVKVSKEFKMLDLRDRSCPLLDYCYIIYEKPNDFSAYAIPNFLADCCRSIGVDGMIYKSVKAPKATNYVFFQPDRSWFKDIEFIAWNGSWVL